jgi:hypothetical protein
MMSKYVIEKNVEPPKRGVYPFGIMQIGDSFAFPASERVRVSAAASVYAKKSTQKGKELRFTVRKVDADTYRIWRVELK